MKDLSKKNRIIIGACLGLLFTVFSCYIRLEAIFLEMKFLLVHQVLIDMTYVVFYVGGQRCGSL